MKRESGEGPNQTSAIKPSVKTAILPSATTHNRAFVLTTNGYNVLLFWTVIWKVIKSDQFFRQCSQHLFNI